MEIKPNCGTCKGEGRVPDPEGQTICPFLPCGECWEWDGGYEKPKTDDTPEQLMRRKWNEERIRANAAEREIRGIEADYSVLWNQYSELLEANEKLRTELAQANTQKSFSTYLLNRSLSREARDEIYPDARTEHVGKLLKALRATAAALDSAWDFGRRTDCLNCAVKDLEGALANVTMEDLEETQKAEGIATEPARTQDEPGSEFLSCSPTHSACVVLQGMAGLCYAAVRSKKHGGQIELPGGKSLPGETPEETAIRETREETGLEVELENHPPIYSAQIEGIPAYVFIANSFRVRGEMRSSSEGEAIWATREEIENGTYAEHTRKFMPLAEMLIDQFEKQRR